jgi:hypothetical protein
MANLPSAPETVLWIHANHGSSVVPFRVGFLLTSPASPPPPPPPPPAPPTVSLIFLIAPCFANMQPPHSAKAKAKAGATGSVPGAVSVTNWGAGTRSPELSSRDGQGAG